MSEMAKIFLVIQLFFFDDSREGIYRVIRKWRSFATPTFFYVRLVREHPSRLQENNRAVNDSSWTATGLWSSSKIHPSFGTFVLASKRKMVSA